MKLFVIDVSRCNGCRNCQIACKDEHCDNAWMPYAQQQPETGQFWCKVEEEVQGSVPKVRIAYTPMIGGQSQKLLDAAGDAAYQREDGLIIIDPEKSKGRKDLCEACAGVYWNEELQIPQTCTGCAHLVDDGQLPRCADSCPTECLRFGEEDELSDLLENAEQFDPESNVYYVNLPKLFVAGTLYDPEPDECIEGASVTLFGPDGKEETVETDVFGDFWFKRLKPGTYRLEAKAAGYMPYVREAIEVDRSINLGDIGIVK